MLSDRVRRHATLQNPASDKKLGMSLLEQCEFRFWRTEILRRLLLLARKQRSLILMRTLYWLWNKSLEGWLNSRIYRY